MNALRTQKTNRTREHHCTLIRDTPYGACTISITWFETILIERHRNSSNKRSTHSRKLDSTDERHATKTTDRSEIQKQQKCNWKDDPIHSLSLYLSLFLYSYSVCVAQLSVVFTPNSMHCSISILTSIVVAAATTLSIGVRARHQTVFKSHCFFLSVVRSFACANAELNWFHICCVEHADTFMEQWLGSHTTQNGVNNK